MTFESQSESLLQRGLSFVSALVGTGTLIGGIALIHGQPELLTLPATQTVFSSEENLWGLSETHLLFALPLGAMIVVFVRTILGWKTFGLFTPMLLAMSYLQSGPFLGPAISIGAILTGMLCAPLLKWLQLSRVAFLGVLIGIVVTCLGAVAQHTDEFLIASAFPVVVTALIVERWWTSWETQGPRQALNETSLTLFVAIAIQLVIASPFLVQLGTNQPLALSIGSSIMMVLLGRYRGLRLSEIGRFRLARSN
jgi:7 transmembrane helices usually fused to an inactive transglutaminase